MRSGAPRARGGAVGRRQVVFADALTPRERLIVEVVRSLHRTRSLADDLYARATAELETPRLVELVTLAGYYGMIAFVLLAFEVDLPAGTEPPF